MNAATVKVTGELSLRCADETSVQKLESPVLLGPLDHVAQNFTPITVVFVYRREGGDLVPLDRLRKALSRLLDYYPHLTGRVVMDPNDRTPRIEQLGKAAKLFTAECSQPLAAFEAVGDDDAPSSLPRLIVTNLPDGGNALLPPFDPTEAGLTRDPILAVQHTRFACGGVSIGFCLRHIICDACGFFQLVRDLAELYRGFRDVGLGDSDCDNSVELSKPPHIRSYMAGMYKMNNYGRQEALKLKPTGVRVLPYTENMSSDSDIGEANRPIPAPIIGRVLRFSSRELAPLKAEANDSNTGRRLSTFCALTAHIWQSVYHARTKLYEAQGLISTEIARQVSCQLLVPIDLRTRNQLAELPPRYFPNAVFSPVFALPTSELLNAPLSVIAASVFAGIQPQIPMKVKNTLQWIAAQSDKSRVLPCFNYEQEGVLVTQWSKFDMYRGTELDVAPTLVAQPFTPLSLYNGWAYFTATEDQLTHAGQSTGVQPDSIDVSLALSKPVWDIIDRDENFRRHREWEAIRVRKLVR